MTEARDDDAGYGPYDADHPPPLAFHQWADLAAKIAQREPDERLDILSRENTDPALFDACNLFWVEALGRQMARGNYRLAQIYATICSAEMRRRAEEPAVEMAARPEHAGGDTDETAVLVALPDRTALPFTPPLPGASPPPATATAEDAKRAESEETAFVPALQMDEDALPFRRDDGKK